MFCKNKMGKNRSKIGQIGIDPTEAEKGPNQANKVVKSDLKMVLKTDQN